MLQLFSTMCKSFYSKSLVIFRKFSKARSIKSWPLISFGCFAPLEHFSGWSGRFPPSVQRGREILGKCNQTIRFYAWTIESLKFESWTLLEYIQNILLEYEQNIFLEYTKGCILGFPSPGSPPPPPPPQAPPCAPSLRPGFALVLLLVPLLLCSLIHPFSLFFPSLFTLIHPHPSSMTLTHTS